MASKSTGRGVIALLGTLLILAGLAGGFLLFLESRSRPDDVIDQFARAQAGCSTRLSFNETGTYYLYREEHPSLPDDVEECAPDPDAFGPFEFELYDPAGSEVPTADDDSITYELDEVTGASVARVEVDETGEYVLTVHGEDALTFAALGRDPGADVQRLEWTALAVAGAGLLVGLVLLLISGRSSKKASTPTMPEGPGWGPPPTEQSSTPTEWTPVASQVPISPTRPDEPVAPEPPPPPLPSRTPAPAPTSWGPPSAGSATPTAGQQPSPLPPPPPAAPDDDQPPRRPAT